MSTQLTLQEFGRKVDTHIAVPLPAASRYRVRYARDFDLLEALEDTPLRAKADNNFRHAEEEGLDPELHEFALKVVAVAVVADLSRGLELNPIDRCAGLGLGIPYFGVLGERSGKSKERIELKGEGRPGREGAKQEG